MTGHREQESPGSSVLAEPADKQPAAIHPEPDAALAGGVRAPGTGRRNDAGGARP